MIQKAHLIKGVKIGVTVTLLGLLLWWVPLDQLIDVLNEVSWQWFAAATAIAFLAEYTNVLQMVQILRAQAISLSTWGVFRVNLLAHFYGLFLPGTLSGGALRWYYFSQQDRKPAQALAAIVFNRLLETVMLILLGLLFWLIEQHYARDQLALHWFLLLLGAFTSAYLMSFNRHVHRLLEALLKHRHVPHWLQEKSGKVLAALAVYGDKGYLFHLLMLCMAALRSGIMIVSFYCLAQAVSIDVSIAALAWIRSCITLILLLPISIGGFGVRESSFVYLLLPYGVLPAAAIVLALMQLARNMVFASAGAMIELNRLWSDRSRVIR